jgi:hypothetical protein
MAASSMSGILTPNRLEWQSFERDRGDNEFGNSRQEGSLYVTSMASQPPSFKQTGRNLKLTRDTELSHRFVPEFVRFGGILIPCPNDDVTFNLGRLASPAKCSVVVDEIVGVETAHGTPRPLIIDFLKCLIGCGVPECAGPGDDGPYSSEFDRDRLLCRLQFVYFGVEILLGPPKLIAVAMAASGNSLRGGRSRVSCRGPWNLKSAGMPCAVISEHCNMPSRPRKGARSRSADDFIARNADIVKNVIR